MSAVLVWGTQNALEILHILHYGWHFAMETPFGGEVSGLWACDRLLLNRYYLTFKWNITF